MSLHTTLDGMWRHDGLYDPESGHTIAQALRAHVEAGNLDPDDHRTHPQRMVDALTDVCHFYLDHNQDVHTSGGEKPHITVIVDYDQLLAGVTEEDSLRASDAEVEHTTDHAAGERSQPSRHTMLPEIDGVPVGFEDIRRIMCDSGIVRVVTDGAGLPLDVGRKTRTIPPAIRRALDIRDGGCRWDGCDSPVSWTDAHHVRHWALGGETALGNLILLCRGHHTAIHEGRAEVRLRPVASRPRGDPLSSI